MTRTPAWLQRARALPPPHGSRARRPQATNAIMRAIDLTALLLAPLAAGVLMTAAGPFAAAAAMSAYCGLAYVPEVGWLIRWGGRRRAGRA